MATTTTPSSSSSVSPSGSTARTPEPPRWAAPIAFGGAGLLIISGLVQLAVTGSSRPLVVGLVFAAVISAVLVPIILMRRAGRGIAAPVGTPENRWSMVAFAGIQAIAAAAGAVWAAGAGHTAFAVALGAWVVFSLIGVVGALAGPFGQRS